MDATERGSRDPLSADAKRGAGAAEPRTGPELERRRLLIAGLALLPAACATPVPVLPPPAVAPPLPQVKLGQRWRYETVDLYRGDVVGELRAQVASLDPLVVALTDARGAPAGEERWARPWDVLVEPAYDLPQHFETPVPLLPDRLEPGAGRDDATWYRIPDSSFRLYWRQQLRAIGWERVRVPAGEFTALRVQRYINFRHWDTWREQPWRIDTLWHAPEVGRWVQREWTGEYRWPGRRPVTAYEDRIRWRLVEWGAGAG